MAEPKKGWFARLTEGLSRSSAQMSEQVAAVFAGPSAILLTESISAANTLIGLSHRSRNSSPAWRSPLLSW